MSDVLRCHISVTRDGDMDACDKPAVGRLHLLDWEDEEFGAGEPYPACRFHLYRLGGNGRAVELTAGRDAPRQHLHRDFGRPIAGCAACTERGPHGPDVFLY